jgi:serine/threonine-protein kinase
MRHVREEVPDVQHTRPELSSALGAVVDRATAKSLDRRYPDAATMLEDLEEALAIETARGGQATGEATTVLRTLPGRARRRLPLRMRHPLWLLAGAALVAVVIAGVALLAASRTHRGNSPPPNVAPRGHEVAVRLGQGAAHDYNPFGDTPENPQQVQFAIDGDPATWWNTEIYIGNTLNNKPGVGFYVDAAPRVRADAAVIQTPTPGFSAQIWAARRFQSYPQGPVGPQSPALEGRGWVKVADLPSVRDGQRAPLDTAGQPFRYYLLWITSLPPGQHRIQIAEFTLFRCSTPAAGC